FPVSGVIQASNTSGGSGTLVVGSATFELQLLANGTLLSTKTVPVTLEPNTAWIQSLSADSTITINASTGQYTATLKNPGASLSNVILQGFLTDMAGQQPSGGSTLFLPGQPAGVLPNGVFTVTGSIGAGATAVSGPATFLLQLKVNGTVTYSRT